ncbi:magnesium transporter [Halopelagius longus]|nr:magnesium transporter [Halopelagius longus]
MRYSNSLVTLTIGESNTCTGGIRNMAGNSASLLTKTQRNRIRDDFDELVEEKKRRDQQRIRERIRSGLFDFHLLADYPDRQFALTFDETPDDELRTALADTTLVVERLRELHGIDRAEVIEEARTRAETVSDATTGTETLSRVELRTAAEIRRETEAEVKERVGTGRWDTRADRLAKLGASAFIPLALIGIFDWYVSGNLLGATAPVSSLLMAILAVSMIGWLLIVAAQALKHDVLPAFRKLMRNPEAAVRGAVTNLFEDPKETLRESWEEL